MPKKRQVNFEFLRIIAMLMVIAMHYLNTGNAAVKLSEDVTPLNHVLWICYAFCNVAVNVYVLISGYFLVDAQWRMGKLLRLIAQVFFYSVLVPVVLIVIGVVPADSYDLYNWLNFLLPVEMEHYWFATAYVALYLFAPVLAAGAKTLSKKQLQTSILLLLFYFSVIKSINPFLIPIDRYGYDFGWFICLFLIASYIRLYGIPFLEGKKRALFIYIMSVFCNYGICELAAWISRKTGKMEYYMDMTYSYNYILVLVSSVALFYVFLNLDLKWEKTSKWIITLASATFGVYLLHENLAFRLDWAHWLNIEAFIGTPLLLLHMIACVLLVFVVGVLVDLCRQKLFGMIGRLIWRKR